MKILGMGIPELLMIPFLLLLWILPTLYSIQKADEKGYGSVVGAMLGIFLGPIGALIVTLLKDKSDKSEVDGKHFRR